MSCFTDRILDPDSLVAPLLRAPTKVVVLKRAVWVPPAPPLPPDEAAEVEKKRKLREEMPTLAGLRFEWKSEAAEIRALTSNFKVVCPRRPTHRPSHKY